MRYLAGTLDTRERVQSRERPVYGITGNGITFASLHLSQSNPLLPSAIGIFFNAYVNV